MAETWDDMKFVLAVSQAGSVNAAAKGLGVNHATILRRVGAFEERHDIRVFHRTARGYVVNPDATPVIEALQAVEASVRAAERVIARKGERFDGVIRVTSTDSLSMTVLPAIVADFSASHPRVQIDLSATNARLDLAKLDADVTIRPAERCLKSYRGCMQGP